MINRYTIIVHAYQGPILLAQLNWTGIGLGIKQVIVST